MLRTLSAAMAISSANGRSSEALMCGGSTASGIPISTKAVECTRAITRLLSVSRSLRCNRADVAQGPRSTSRQMVPPRTKVLRCTVPPLRAELSMGRGRRCTPASYTGRARRRACERRAAAGAAGWQAEPTMHRLNSPVLGF
eukprot:scaffold114715_cov63-Phaeocystis_antarctica.AAC.11